MIKFSLNAGVAAALIAFTAPAMAANTTSNSTARPSQEASQRADAAASDRQICVRTQQGGSRLMRRVCKTAQEWETAGGLPDPRER
jgi:hypothetical protein